MKEYQWFLTWLSVRPGRRLAISDHLLPSSLWASDIIRSSSSVQPFLFIQGSKWLCQRSRHCLPLRPGIPAWARRSAIAAQLFVPYSVTIWRIASSSASVQARLLLPQKNTNENEKQNYLKERRKQLWRGKGQLTFLRRHWLQYLYYLIQLSWVKSHEL